MAKTLTIFTPTYNRAHLLERSFSTLCNQDCLDFVWMIIDDGSTDNTKDVVDEFRKTAPFEIQYYYKENGGLHTGYNEAISHAETELCMCIDSDDWIADHAVSRILSLWEKVKRPDCAGIVALDAYPDGKPTVFIDSNNYVNLNAYDTTHKWAGDRKLVVRTDLYKSVAPMPSFRGEKNFNPQYMHYQIAQNYSFYVLNEVICIVDYQETGMSAGIYRQFTNSPNSWIEYRRMQMIMRPNHWLFILKTALHFDSACFLAKRPASIWKDSPYKLLTTVFLPLGWLLSLYIRKKSRS